MAASAAADFSEQVKALEAALQSRLSEHMAQVRKEFSEDIESFRQCALINVADEATKRRRRESLPPLPTPEMSQDCFVAALLEPATAIRVNGKVLHVHGQVLRKIPYFAAFLEGVWQDRGMPQVDLACSVEEFGLLVRRLYTGEILGSSMLPIESCASAIRIALASGMLLIDQYLPELRDILVASVKNTEDMGMVDAAKAAFPESIVDVFDEVDAAILPDDLVSMVRQSKSDHAKICADQILEARRGRLDASMLIPIVSKLLESTVVDDHQWARKVMQKHMTCNDAMLAVQQSCASWSLHCCFRGCVGHKESLQAVAADLITRCAKAGSVKAVFELGVASQEQNKRKKCLCGRNGSERSIYCFGPKTAGAIAHALLVVPHELKHLAAMMATMPPTDEVLASLGASAQPVLTSLAVNPVTAISWCSTTRLQMLPTIVRKTFCSKLIGVLDHASPEVAKAIEQALD